MKDCTKEFSVIEGLIEYVIIIVICYLLARLFFYILWKKYNGDNNVLRDKTEYFFEDYNSVMWVCKLMMVFSVLPFVNIFVMFTLLAVNLAVLATFIVNKLVNYSWIPKKKTKDKLK